MGVSTCATCKNMSASPFVRLCSTCGRKAVQQYIDIKEGKCRYCGAKGAHYCMGKFGASSGMKWVGGL